MSGKKTRPEVFSDSMIDGRICIFFIILSFLSIRQVLTERLPSAFIPIIEDSHRFPDPVLHCDHDECLPEPVERYLNLCRVYDRIQPDYAQIAVSGYEKSHPGSCTRPVRGIHYYSLGKPGFFQTSWIQTGRLTWMRSTRTYSGIQGTMKMHAFSLLPILSVSGMAMSRFALIRYFCEAAWFPWILLPSSFLRWEPENSRMARMVVSYHQVPVSFEVTFSRKGQICTISSREEKSDDDILSSYDIGVSCKQYNSVNGLTIPTELDIRWSLHHNPVARECLRVTHCGYHTHISGKEDFRISGFLQDRYPDQVYSPSKTMNRLPVSEKKG